MSLTDRHNLTNKTVCTYNNMATQRPLNSVNATLNEDVTVKNNVNGTQYVSVMATLKNGKTRRLMTYAKQAIQALEGMKAGETKNLYGHFGSIDMKTGQIDKESRGTFFPIGESTPREVASQEA